MSWSKTGSYTVSVETLTTMSFRILFYMAPELEPDEKLIFWNLAYLLLNQSQL